jgi:hypothetical protein
MIKRIIIQKEKALLIPILYLGTELPPPQRDMPICFHLCAGEKNTLCLEYILTLLVKGIAYLEDSVVIYLGLKVDNSE